MMELTIENIKNTLNRFEKNEHERGPGWGVERYRMAGYLEACLQAHGVLHPDKPLEPRTRTVTHLWFFPIKWKREEQESYLAHIIRLSVELVKKHDPFYVSGIVEVIKK